MSFNKSQNIKINIKDIELWLDNRRHDYSFSSQEEVINWFIEKHWTHLYKTIQEIVEHGGLFNKLKVVKQSSSSKYFVIDGNTRFSALKILMQPKDTLGNYTKEYNKVKKLLKSEGNNIEKLFNSNETEECELFNEEDIDIVVYHEHEDGIKKAAFDPYIQSKNQGHWHHDITKDATTHRPPKYLLERYLNKERANHIGIDFDSNKRLLSVITDEVKDNIAKLIELINNGPKGQVKVNLVEKLFYDKFPKGTKVVPIEPKFNLETENNTPTQKNKTTKKKPYIGNKGCKTIEDVNKKLELLIGQLSNHGKNGLMIYKQLQEYKDISKQKCPTIAMAYLRVLLDVCYRQKHDNWKKSETNNAFYRKIIEENRNKISQTAFKKINSFLSTIENVVHGQDDTIIAENVVTYFNALFPIIEIVVREICNNEPQT